LKRIILTASLFCATAFSCILLSFQSGISIEDEEHYVNTIVIDAGHGGHDNGCSGSHSKEKVIALDVALKLGSYIEQYLPDVKVIYTRKTDKFVELHERAAIANRNNADLFISIHCNAGGGGSAYGTETYVMGLHKTDANLSVAKRENDVILMEDDHNNHYDGFDPKSPTAHIIFTLFQSAYLDQSILLASKVEEQFEKRVSRKSRGVKQAGFLVLYKTAMPSVLIETGFLTNRTEEDFLYSEKGQEYMASAIYRAFRDYKNELEAKSDTEPLEIIENTEPVENNPGAFDDDVVFKVQFYASSNLYVSSDKVFSKVKSEDIFTIHQAGLYKYQIGSFSGIDDAFSKQSKIRKRGFKDAFVVAYQNGERITIDAARKIVEK
jgi:N-acetylmuramoyl-L-alanine amidase